MIAMTTEMAIATEIAGSVLLLLLGNGTEGNAVWRSLLACSSSNPSRPVTAPSFIDGTRNSSQPVPVQLRGLSARFTGGVDLTQFDGIAPYTALKLVSEIGTDMRRWPTAQHF